MSITINLIDKIRSLAYFSDFTEDAVEVPAKPFLRELLEGSLMVEALSIEDLAGCLETCIYFGLDTASVSSELLWKVGEREETFRQWFAPEEDGQAVSWRFDPGLSIPIGAELTKTYGSSFKREGLIRLGIRWLDPCWDEISKAGNLRLLKWRHESGVSWPKNMTHDISWWGHLDCLRYACENGCNWDDGTLIIAFQAGHGDCLKYFWDRGAFV